MTRHEAEVFAELRNKKLWRMFGNWLCFEIENKVIHYVSVGEYLTNYGMAYLSKTGQFMFPNEFGIMPPKAMLKAVEKKLRREVIK